VLVVGATGTIGRAVVDALGDRHEIAAASFRQAPIQVDLADKDSIGRMFANKLMGQVQLVRLGLPWVGDGGSFTLTSGYLGRYPTPGSPAVSMVNAALEGFTRAAALELPRGIRINAVSPRWIRETLQARGLDPAPGTPAAVVAQAYVKSLEGNQTGQVLDP
jgi:NAD(P)-dependent dehydrogenase (short-subunit alcohol dehydrogenase family)